MSAGSYACTYLKAVLKALWVDLGECSSVRISYQLLYLREDVPVEVKIEVGLLRADDPLEVLEAHLVAILEFAVLVGLLLDGVVRQVGERVRDVVQVILSAASPNVAFLVAVALQAAIDAR